MPGDLLDSSPGFRGLWGRLGLAIEATEVCLPEGFSLFPERLAVTGRAGHKVLESVGTR